ncbi:hypothetical protein GGI15_001361 [Coemansia interrupta]|uniref:Thioesterase domain-containing protein n=1 Tax=Coemansia interrupta TaxID=1126814 RepID=A0A9W8LNP8_9FUNG|nr:hypothetical protein GGI15_001361 [Coemansia interrupta]
MDNAPCLDIEWPIYHTPQRIKEAKPLLQKLSNIPLVQSLVKQENVVRKEFFWPVTGLWMHQTPETMLYGALSGSNDLPLVPVIFQWKPGCTPEHLNKGIFESCISSAVKQNYASIRVPGVTIVQYMGPNLGMSGVANGIAGELPTVHPGVLTTIIDHFTARLSYSNMPQKPTFTANLQLEYLVPVRTDSFVAADAWITSIEGRKTVVSAYMADALTGQVFVKAKALFVSAK